MAFEDDGLVTTLIKVIIAIPPSAKNLTIVKVFCYIYLPLPGVLGVVNPGRISLLCLSIIASASVCISKPFILSVLNTYNKKLVTNIWT